MSKPRGAGSTTAGKGVLVLGCQPKQRAIHRKDAKEAKTAPRLLFCSWRCLGVLGGVAIFLSSNTPIRTRLAETDTCRSVTSRGPVLYYLHAR